MATASTGQLVEGIGDEVVLFGAFLVLSVCMLVYLSLRGSQGRAARGPDETQHQVQDEFETQENHQTNTTFSTASDEERSDVLSETTTDQTDGLQSDNCRQHHLCSEESTLRPRFPHTQGAGSSNEDQSSLSIRLILPNNSTLPVNVQLSTTLGEMRRTYFQEQLAEHRPVRFIYRGRVLDDASMTLRNLEIGPQHAIHIHIGNPRPPDTERTQHFGPQPPEEMLDISRLFLPLFGLILAICWVCMFCYPNVFSLLTKFLLFLLSVGYVFMMYVSTRAPAE